MKKVDLVLRHYNKIRPINCKVVSGDEDNLFTIEIVDNESKGLEVIKGDPVLIGTLNKDDSLNLAGGSVIGANKQNHKYILCKNEVLNISKEQEKRQYERFPTSLLGEIKYENSSDRASLYIKDFSYLGMGVYSSGDFNIDDKVDISIFLSNNVVTFDGSIVRKKINFGRNEYGIQIIHRDKNSMLSTQAQLNNLVQNERNLIHRQLINAKSTI
ncbi:PilZ domain-containing protein [Ruminiclostridium herbifermentans]|uniref:PilZ domain-containing protein n=1 Tax=Ruminiclostridium herbifermentans TaxID=2488810 RepID=A0A4U7JAX3_9FIRM|nr:PilZ domain-containing protein [Ruminiclostridium herbifermentans]QNU67831.1 PilZ domain-containing protein [Ruminiclostridium herbifermentans]